MALHALAEAGNVSEFAKCLERVALPWFIRVATNQHKTKKQIKKTTSTSRERKM